MSLSLKICIFSSSLCRGPLGPFYQVGSLLLVCVPHPCLSFISVIH